MRFKVIGLLVVPFVLAAGAGILLSQGMDEPDGLPDISGDWVGKAKYKDYGMTGNDEGDKGAVPLEVEVEQEGPEILLGITPEGDSTFTMSGLIGDGHFFAWSDSEEEIAFMIGHVKKKGKQIKGTFLSGQYDRCTEVKISLKRPK